MYSVVVKILVEVRVKILMGPLPQGLKIIEEEELPLHTQERTSCNHFVDILQQTWSTSRYQNAFAWLTTAC